MHSNRAQADFHVTQGAPVVQREEGAAEGGVADDSICDGENPGSSPQPMA
jgi:hypothetical protein